MKHEALEICASTGRTGMLNSQQQQSDMSIFEISRVHSVDNNYNNDIY